MRYINFNVEDWFQFEDDLATIETLSGVEKVVPIFPKSSFEEFRKMYILYVKDENVMDVLKEVKALTSLSDVEIVPIRKLIE